MHQIGVTGTSHSVGTVMRQSSLCQDGVLLTGSELAQGRFASQDHFTVTFGSAALCGHQIILVIVATLQIVVKVIQMRTFRPNRFVLGTDTLVYQNHWFTTDFVSVEVIFTTPDGAVTTIFGRVGWFIIIDNVTFAVVVKEEGGVDAMHFGHRDRLTPTFIRVLGLEDDIAHAVHQSDNQIESLVLFTIFNVWSIDTAGDAETLLKDRLGVSVDDITAEVPIHQILAVPDRDAWPIDKRAVGHEKVIALTTDRGVRVGAGNDRIEILCLRVERCIISSVVAAVGEILKDRSRR